MGGLGGRRIAPIARDCYLCLAAIALFLGVLPSGFLCPRNAARADDAKPWIAVGRVTDGSGEPMADVKVRAATGMGTLLGGGTTFTDAEGKYELRFGPGILIVNEGPYCQAAAIGATKAGLSERNMNRQGDCVAALSRVLDAPIDLSKLDTWGKPAERVFLPGVRKEINFVMVPAARASGRLVDAEGKPLAGYSVSLTGKELPPAQNVIEHDTTDDQGRFELSDLPGEFAFQFLVEPAERGPPWRAWASMPMTFADPGQRALSVAVKSAAGKMQVAGQEFELQIVGEGINWREALAQAVESTHILYQSDAGDWQIAEGARVEADAVRIVIAPDDGPAQDRKE
ncbi:MAG TPA: carboxypeptidase-like regulatory domain-containing protein [Pirellulales bacterium]|nr:carboxypeptidase-like regulatory domain-containing protein [Pirellulales bacterium]